MPVSLKGRSVLTLDAFSPGELQFLLKLAAELKAAKYAGTEQRRLQGKNIALIFEKDSTRTRTGFEVAAYDQGAHVTYLGPSGTQLGRKESIKDTARVLGRMYDAIEYRGFAQSAVETMAVHAGVPVYNGLTDDTHPTQALADFMTMREFTHKHLSDMSVVFIGDTRNNVARTLAMGAMQLGMDMRLCGPKALWPDETYTSELEGIAAGTNAKLKITDDLSAACSGADFVYTDVWVSMGEPKERWKERFGLLRKFRVTADVMRATGNRHAKFMHCLPAFHDLNTEIGDAIGREHCIEGIEVTNEVFESAASIVFDQAENRMHSIKAILVATLGA